LFDIKEKYYKQISNVFLENYLFSELSEYLFNINYYEIDDKNFFAELFLKCAYYFISENQLNKSLDIVKKINDLNRLDDKTQLVKSQVFYLQNNVKDAVTGLKQTNCYTKQNYFIKNYILASYELSENNLDLTKKYYNNILYFYPDNTAVKYNLALINNQNISDLTQLNLQNNFKNNFLLYNHFKNKNYKKIIDSDFKSMFSDYYKALSYFKINNFNKAFILINSVTEQSLLKNPDFIFNKSLIYSKNNYITKSIEILESNEFENTLFYKSKLLLAQNYFQKNEIDKSYNIIKNINFPNQYNDTVNNLLGNIFFKKQDFKKAQHYYEKINSPDLNTKLNLILAYQKNKNYKNAVLLCKELIKSDYKPEFQIYKILGMLYYDLDNLTESKKWFKKSLNLKPNQTDIKNFLKIID
jgi:hypothetical protein